MEGEPRRPRILVVDDEPGLPRTLRRMLRGDHDVTVLDSARAALDLCLAGESFDLILCDLMMPDMTGMELYAELRRRNPDQADRMAFVTGGAFNDEAQTFLEASPGRSLEKPFTVAVVRDFVGKRLR